MTRRERLTATLNGIPVDRPPVNFYEIDGSQDIESRDPFNIYSDPSWKPLIQLAREKTDCIVRRCVGFRNAPEDPLSELTTSHTETMPEGSRITTRTVRIGKKILTTRTRRDPDVNTVWTLEHLLKDTEDLRAYLGVPGQEPGGEPDTGPILDAERSVGEAGIAAVDTSDPLCCAAPLFDMGQFTVIAMTEQALFHRLMDRFARLIHWQTEAIAAALPGRLWRICGPEYASPPYLPPKLFHEYVTVFDRPMVESIHRHGGSRGSIPTAA